MFFPKILNIAEFQCHCNHIDRVSLIRLQNEVRRRNINDLKKGITINIQTLLKDKYCDISDIKLVIITEITYVSYIYYN